MVKNPFPSACLVWAGHRGNLRNRGLGTQLCGDGGNNIVEDAWSPSALPCGPEAQHTVGAQQTCGPGGGAGGHWCGNSTLSFLCSPGGWAPGGRNGLFFFFFQENSSVWILLLLLQVRTCGSLANQAPFRE